MNFWTSSCFSLGKQPCLVLGLLSPPDFSKFPENLMFLAFEDRLTAEEWCSHRTEPRVQWGSSGELGVAALPGTTMKGGVSMAHGDLEGARICCHHGSKVPPQAGFVCLPLALLSCSCETAASAALRAQRLLPSHSMLCPELPRHTAGIGGCLKSLFETGDSSGKAHLLLHSTFTLVSTEGMNLGGLALVVRLILLIYLSIPKVLQLVPKFMEMPL